MKALSLDLSKSSTGWAWWNGSPESTARFGSWTLGSDYTTNGQTFAKLQSCMVDLFEVMPFEWIFVEPPIVPAQLQGNTTIHTIRLATGLMAHVESFAHAYRPVGVRGILEVNVESWRPDFIGKIENAEAKAEARRAKKAGNARASARDTLKALTMARCRQLGFAPRKNDEADAIGILTYGLLAKSVTPPWIANETLRQPVRLEA